MSEIKDLLTGGSLKLTISKIADPDEEFKVMFNPEQYSENLGISYHKPKSPRDQTNRGIKKFDNPTYSFDFLLDGTGATGKFVDVVSEVEKFKKITAKPNEKAAKGKKDFNLKLSWGHLQIKCIFLSATINYTLFSRTGVPLRAKINCQFEGIPNADAFSLAKVESHLRHAIGAGLNLASASATVYGTAEHMAKVAGINGLKSFRDIVPGQLYAFPPKSELQ